MVRTLGGTALVHWFLCCDPDPDKLGIAWTGPRATRMGSGRRTGREVWRGVEEGLVELSG